jgi:UDP-galactopyranose mutase
MQVADACGNLHLLGRLAQYQYYNIDAIVSQALRLAQTFRSPD